MTRCHYMEVLFACQEYYQESRSREELPLVDLLPAGRFLHICDLVNFTELRGKRCLIIDGRQSAFEWAALINEAGASTVHASLRHARPAFAQADWSWVNPMVDAMVTNPGCFRHLSAEEIAQTSDKS